MFDTFTPNQLYTWVIATFVVFAVAVILVVGLRQIVLTGRESYRFLADPDQQPSHLALLHAFARLVLASVLIQLVLGSSEIWGAMAPQVSREWFDTPITTPGGVIATIFVGAKELLYPAAYLMSTVMVVMSLIAAVLLAIRTNVRLRAVELVNRAISTWRERRAPKTLAPRTSDGL